MKISIVNEITSITITKGNVVIDNLLQLNATIPTH